MPSRFRERQRRGWPALALLALLGCNARAADPPTAPVRRSALERLRPERLQATHDDAVALRKLRHDVPARPGRHDYRAILHAHAEDSAHTGGTRPEMLADARRAGVNVILLTDHLRPPRDFITQSWRGLHDGVLFIPGTEARGFLLYPPRSVMERMEEPVPALLDAVREGGGLAFLSHIEERPDHPMDRLDGLEIYNRHADAKKDRAGLAALVLYLTDPATIRQLEESVRLYPEELLAAQVTYPDDYLAKWDRETKTRRLTGVAANDCHHNTVLVVKVVDASAVLVGTNVDSDDQMRRLTALLRPSVRRLTEGRKPGDVVTRIDLDPYERSFRNVSTHVLATELTEPAVRDGLRQGHAYVSHDWVCDPTGFRFELAASGKDEPVAIQGDEVKFQSGTSLVARLPLPCKTRLIKDGRHAATAPGDTAEWPVEGPGVYRVEAWVVLDGEERPWLYSNPIYVR